MRTWFFEHRLLFFIAGGVCALALMSGGGVYVWHERANHPAATYKTPEESDVYVRFVMEAYDLIEQNYWRKTADTDFSQLFQLSLQKAENNPIVPSLATTSRSGVASMLKTAFDTATSSDAKKQLAQNTLIIALTNLPPQGRNELLSDTQEKQLRQTVSNINPATDLYKDLGLPKGAPAAAVETAYKAKEAVLAKATSTEAKAELAQVQYSHTVLTKPETKELYDTTQIEPTVFGHVLGTTLYLYVTKIAPTTLAEFAKAVDAASTTPNLESMAIDLRSNIGGSLDFLQYFLGLFIGQNQFAFDLFHQDDYQVQRTTTPRFDELARYKEIAILTDSMSQSTAELTAATFKRYHLAHTVGTKTRGWGSVENTFPLNTVIDPDTKYSLLIVHSLTLRDDNQPIEGNGVDADVDTTVTGWQSRLAGIFRSSSLVSAIEQVMAHPPTRF